MSPIYDPEQIIDGLAKRVKQQDARIADLEAALVEAVELIRQWHSMDTAGILTEEEHALTWEIYQKHSPEMKRINALLKPEQS